MRNQNEDSLDVTQLGKKVVTAYLSRKANQLPDIKFFKQHDINGQFIQITNSNIKKGLTNEQVAINKKKYGQNVIPKRQIRTFCDFFMDAISDPMLIILIVAAILSIILQGLYSEQKQTFWVQGASILIAVAVCSLVASVNDYQKQQQFQALVQLQQETNKYDVCRDGQRTTISRQELVVGDIVLLESGMQVPVDGILVENVNIIADQSTITGESHEVYKDKIQRCIPQEGTSPCPSPVILSFSKIISGQGKMLAVVVGQGSQYGRIKQLIEGGQNQQTPLQIKLQQMASKIGYFGLISAIFIFTVLAIRMIFGDIIPEGWKGAQNIGQILRYMIIAVTIIVVAIPQGLPLAVTLSLAFSVKKMYHDNNLVRKLMSCETMGGANYICTDKTGTLTANKMSVVEAWTGKSYKFSTADSSSFKISKKYRQILINSIYHNTSSFLRPEEKGSQTEVALLKFAEELAPTQKYERYRQRAAEAGYFLRMPFNSDRKRMTTGVQINEENYIFMKGGAQIIVQTCQSVLLPDGTQQAINKSKLGKQISNMAERGLRTIGIAYKKSDIPKASRYRRRDSLGVQTIQKQGFTLLMIVGIKDILRKETRGAIEACKKAGIRVIMVTGDSKITAKAIAQESQIINEEDLAQIDEAKLCMEGNQFERLLQLNQDGSPQLKKDKRQNIFVDIAANLRVLARSRPEHKYQLVSGLIKLGNIVAVTGDGTNDAPALVRADVGFAMGKSGTQIAKNSADIIIMDDNFESIVRAVVWGRNIYDSIRKFLQFQLTVNFVAVGLSIVSAVLIRQSVLTAIQMLWVNLIMDSLASLALATEPPNDQILLNRKPHSRKQGLISSRMAKHIIGQAIYQFLIIMFILFYGQEFIPEFPDQFDNVIGQDFGAKYNNGIRDSGTVVNGAFYKINGDDAYFDYFQKYNVYSRHFTFIFNTFVMMQVFNFFNCRKIHDELNLLSGFFNNWIYMMILIGIVAFQIVIVQLLNIPFKLYQYGGLTLIQWLISVGIAITVIPLSIMLRLLPFGKEAVQQESDSQSQAKEKIQKDNPLKLNQIK